MHLATTRIFAVVAIFVAATVIACGGDSNPDPSPSSTPGVEASPTPPSGAVATPTPPPRGPSGDGPTGPGPQPGAPCPVEQDVCDFARRLLPLVEQGNADAIVAMAETVPATCPAGGLGGPSAALCSGAAPGEVRRGYWDVQGGEGLVVTEAEWRRTLGRWFDSIRAAQGADVYGPGTLRIGAISCARQSTEPSGRCGREVVRVHFTFINPPTMDPARGTGLPGQRVSFHFAAHRTAAGELRIEGIGTVVPPNTVLLPFEIDAVDRDGKAVVIQHYPWTP